MREKRREANQLENMVEQVHRASLKGNSFVALPKSNSPSAVMKKDKRKDY